MEPMGVDAVLKDMAAGSRDEAGVFTPVRNGEPAPGARADLHEAPPRVRLAQIARDASQTCQEKPCAEEFRCEGEGPYSSRELLSVLTFSYATGVFPLERIGELMQKDVLYFSLIGRLVPSPSALRGFRRLERIALASCLTKFYEICAAACHDPHHRQQDTASWLQVLKLAHPLPRNAHAVSRLVRERINQATWIDRMLLDY